MKPSERPHCIALTLNADLMCKRALARGADPDAVAKLRDAIRAIPVTATLLFVRAACERIEAAANALDGNPEAVAERAASGVLLRVGEVQS